MKRYAAGIALLILGGALVAFWFYLKGLTEDRSLLGLGIGLPLVIGLFAAANGARILISRSDGHD